MKCVIAQLAGMRKPQEFVVYPFKADEPNAPITVQSDRAIGQFDRKTGQGVLNWRGSHSKYFMHLTRFSGAEPYQFPPAFVAQCQEHQIGSGDLIGTSAITGPVYAA